jgi:hypothetical protein
LYDQGGRGLELRSSPPSEYEEKGPWRAPGRAAPRSGSRRRRVRVFFRAIGLLLTV